MRLPRSVAAWSSVLAVVAAACAPAYRGAVLSGPIDVRDPTVAQGQRLFDRHCHQCHPGASAGLGPGIILVEPIIRFQVRHGLGAMPSFGPDLITDEELDALVAYLMVVGEHGMTIGSP